MHNQADGLLAEERKGRNRYVRLAAPDVAEMIEALAARAPECPVPVRSLNAARGHRDPAFARICHDHPAGSLAVAITDAMTTEGLLSWDYGPTLTTSGAHWLRDWASSTNLPDRLRDRMCAPASTGPNGSRMGTIRSRAGLL